MLVQFSALSETFCVPHFMDTSSYSKIGPPTALSPGLLQWDMYLFTKYLYSDLYSSCWYWASNGCLSKPGPSPIEGYFEVLYAKDSRVLGSINRKNHWSIGFGVSKFVVDIQPIRDSTPCVFDVHKPPSGRAGLPKAPSVLAWRYPFMYYKTRASSCLFWE